MPITSWKFAEVTSTRYVSPAFSCLSATVNVNSPVVLRLLLVASPDKSTSPIFTPIQSTFTSPLRFDTSRSEERRVGKECGSEWAPQQEKRQKNKKKGK